MYIHSENNRRIAKNSIVLGIRMFLVLFLNLYITKITLEVLGVEDFGIYNVICGFASMFAFLNISMSNGVQRFYNYELGRNGFEGVRKVYVSSLVIQILLVGIVVLLAETLGLWYLHNKMVIPIERLAAAQLVFQSSVVSFVFIILQVPYNAAIMAHEHMNFYAVIGIIDIGLKLVIAILIPYANADKLVLYSILFTFVNFCCFVLVLFYSKHKFVELKLCFHLDRKLLKSMLSFSGWNIFGTFSNMMREQGINLILNLFFGPIVNAARGITYQISAGIQGFVANLSLAVRPQIVQSYAQEQYSRTINLMCTLSKFSGCFLYIISYPIILEVQFILNLWLGGDIPEYTVTFVKIVIFITFLNNMNSAVSTVVHATGKMCKYQVVGSVINLSSLPVAYVFLQLGYSPTSVFWVCLLFTFIMQIVSLIILKSIIDFSFKLYWNQVILPICLLVTSTFIFPLFPYAVMGEGLFRLVAVIIVDILVSSIAFYAVVLSRDEKNFVKVLLRKIIS